MPLVGKLKAAGLTKSKKRTTPLWLGPESPEPNGGVTQSMLNSFLACRERHRIKYIEGLQPVPVFSHKTEYGSMWHKCEEHYAKSGNATTGHTSGKPDWERALVEHCQKLAQRYPHSGEQIQHWMSVCRTQFPIYVKWWENHPDMKNRTPLLQEQVFHVPYKLPSGRVVYMRGRWDSVDLVTHKGQSGIWLMENKSKGDINFRQLQRQLLFDMQTTIYVVALEEHIKQQGPLRCGTSKGPSCSAIIGVRYNVVRRPLAGGKGSIVRKKGSKNVPAESAPEFYARLGEVIENAVGAEYEMAEGEHYFFARFNVKITQADIDRFKQRFLNPVLEQLCQWYEYVAGCMKTDLDPFTNHSLHWQYPYGTYSTVAEGGEDDVDQYLMTGSEVGLTRNVKLFKELE